MKLNKKVIGISIAVLLGIGACNNLTKKEIPVEESLKKKMDYSQVSSWSDRSIYVDYQHGAILKEDMTKKQAEGYERAKKIMEKNLSEAELKELEKQREERRKEHLKEQAKKKEQAEKKAEEDAYRERSKQERLENHRQEKERKELQKRNEDNADEMKRQLEGLN